MIRWWICLLVVVLSGVLNAGTITLATYNVENYLATDRLADGIFRQTYPKPEGEKQALRKVIALLGADILVMQEMGPRPYLEELRRDLENEGVKYPYLELIEAADPDRHVAVLSKLPFTAVRKHTDLTFPYFGGVEKVKRGLLELRVETEGGELTVFAVHLKSRFTERADDPNSALRRLGEAKAVAERILKVFPNPEKARFVVMGDCNDLPESEPLAALEGKDKTILSTLLPISDANGQSWTHFYRKEGTHSRVDHVLVSPPLLLAVENGSAAIGDWPEVDRASDHRPVRIKLDFGLGGKQSGP